MRVCVRRQLRICWQVRFFQATPTLRRGYYQLLNFWGRHVVPAASALSSKDATGGKWRFLGASTLLTLGVAYTMRAEKVPRTG